MTNASTPPKSGKSTPPRLMDATTLDVSQLALARPPMTQEQFDAEFAYHKPKEETEFKRQLKKQCDRYTFPFTSCAALQYTLTNIFPVLDWLPDYTADNLPYDLIGGLTGGIMHVPQGIAYALLAKVPAVEGLYTSFLPPLVYTIFGTSRHCSIGAFAVVSLMTGLAITRISDDLKQERDSAILNNSTVPEEVSITQIASTLTMLIGVIQILMGLLRLDFMSTYFSDQVVSGFTTGASLHVFVSQLKAVFGFRNVTRHDGEPGYLLKNVYELTIRLPDTSIPTLIISICCIAFLLVGKEVLNPLINKLFKLRVPVPYELILIIIVTATSYLMDFKGTYDVAVVGALETGFPSPSLPVFWLWPRMITDALAISVIIIAVHISLAKMFAKKFQYSLDANQELYALGFASTVSSFFPVFPVACSLGRTLVNVEVGSRTLLSNLFSSAFLLSIIMYLGQFFDTLPMPVLSAVVIVALKSLLYKFKELRVLWPISKIDFTIWVVSFVSTAFIDVTPGLAISIGFALFTTIIREQCPRWSVLGNVHGTMDFRDSNRYDDVFFFHGVCIFRFDSPLLFTNVERFKSSVMKAYREWENSHEYYVFRVERTSNLMTKAPSMASAMVEAEKAERTSETGSNDSGNAEEEVYETSEPMSRHFIIDCSGFTFVDYMGVSALKEIYVDLLKSGVLVYFASAKAPVREMFESCGFYKFVPKSNFYPTLRDSVAFARLRQEEYAHAYQS